MTNQWDNAAEPRVGCYKDFTRYQVTFRTGTKETFVTNVGLHDDLSLPHILCECPACMYGLPVSLGGSSPRHYPGNAVYDHVG